MTKAQLALYLADKTNSWSPTTLRSEAARLRPILDRLDGDAEALYQHLQTLSPYSRLTTWTRVVAFWSHIYQGKANPYATFREKNANFFKNVYTKKKVGISYEEAMHRIYAIADHAIRARALDIIKSGCRYAESTQPKGNGFICGKGGKLRTDFRPSDGGPEFGGSYWTFWRQLKQSTGLKPHDLRKLALTKAAASGAQASDLMEIAGWSGINTASWYLQPQTESRLKGFLR